MRHLSSLHAAIVASTVFVFARGAGRPNPADELVLGRGADTVWTRTDSAGRYLSWTHTTKAGAHQRWRSLPIYMWEAKVTLARIDADSLVDLFWTIDDEEMVGGQIVLASGQGARVALRPKAADGCRVPELRDVNGDGLLDMIAYRPFGLDKDECRLDAVAAPCAERYLTEWTVVYLQQSDGSFVERPTSAKEFYRSLATRYSADASTLRETLKPDHPRRPVMARCNQQLARRLQQMSQRAAALGAL